MTHLLQRFEIYWTEIGICTPSAPIPNGVRSATTPGEPLYLSLGDPPHVFGDSLGPFLATRALTRGLFEHLHDFVRLGEESGDLLLKTLPWPQTPVMLPLPIAQEVITNQQTDKNHHQADGSV